MARFNFPPIPEIRTAAMSDAQVRNLLFEWMEQTRETLQEALNDLAAAQQPRREPLQMPEVTVADLISASPRLRAGAAGRLVQCVDDTGGAVPAFSDGVTWRRVTDRAEVST